MATPKSSKAKDLAPSSDPTPEAPVVETAAVAEPDPNELVSIFNRNPKGGDFVEHVYEDIKNGDGNVIKRKAKIEWRAVGSGFSTVPRHVAEKWKRMFPTAIVDSSEVTKARAPAPADVELTKAALAENADLKVRLLNMEKMISDLQRAQATGG
jgi:hypothetical protein